MLKNNAKQPLPAYHYSQKILCRVISAPEPDHEPTMFSYKVEISGDRRQGILTSNDKGLRLGEEIKAEFSMARGKKIVLVYFPETAQLEKLTSDEEMKAMSLLMKGSLVSVIVVEKTDNNYIATYKDYWGETVKGTLVSSQPLKIGDCADAAVCNESKASMSFVSVLDIEKEIDRIHQRDDYFSQKDAQPSPIAEEMDWMAAVIHLSGQSEEMGDVFQPLIEESEALIDNLQKEGLKLHWMETVEALKMYAFPKDEEAISNILKQFIEKYSEAEVLEFLSYRLHPNKEVPMNPVYKDILGALAAK